MVGTTGVNQPECNVLENRPVEEKRFLLNKADKTSQVTHVHIAKILTINIYSPLEWIIESSE